VCGKEVFYYVFEKIVILCDYSKISIESTRGLDYPQIIRGTRIICLCFPLSPLSLFISLSLVFVCVFVFDLISLRTLFLNFNI